MISVIMLTFNRENFLARQINCILNQTFKNFEFIIVDNGSTDKSGFIAENFAKSDSRIKVFHINKNSIGFGRNFGLDNSHGNFITFVDDDDSCSEDFLQFLYDLLTDNHADISICSSSSKNFDEKFIWSPEQAIIKLLWRKYFNVAFPTKLFKKNLFDSLRFPENVKHEDIFLMPKILAKADKIAYHVKSKYNFFRHDGNNSAWTQNHKLLNSEILNEYLFAYRERTDWLCKIFPNNSDLWNYFNWSFMLSMVEKVKKYSLKDCEKISEKLSAELFKNREKIISSEFLQDFEKKWFEELIINREGG